jgi:hypothetical protein
MKKLLLIIITSFALTGMSYAGSFGIGVSGSIAQVEGSGSETTDVGTVAGGTANKNNQDVSSGAMIGSIFVDYQFDNGWALGFDHVPGSADVGESHTRTETAQGIAGVDAAGAVTRKAAAEVENFNTIYATFPMGNFFGKLGWSQVDVNTKETVPTDSGSYGNKTIDGITYGIGLSGSLGGLETQTSLEFTDFDTLTLKDSGNVNTITADLDVTQLKFALIKKKCH